MSDNTKATRTNFIVGLQCADGEVLLPRGGILDDKTIRVTTAVLVDILEDAARRVDGTITLARYHASCCNHEAATAAAQQCTDDDLHGDDDDVTASPCSATLMIPHAADITSSSAAASFTCVIYSHAYYTKRDETRIHE